MRKKQRINGDITIFLTGGGTGGHIYPCVSILNELQKRDNVRLFYVGNSKNPEYNVVSGINENLDEAKKVTFLDVCVSGMPRSLNLKLLKWFFNLLVSVFKCLAYALKFKPDAVFATGGYVSAPMVIVSNILKIPYVMHDSDAHPGIVTRAFSGGAKVVNLAFNEGNRFVKAKRITNFKNPVRDEFFTVSRADAREALGLLDNFVILIMGGSQGAKSINNAALGLIKHFSKVSSVSIIFQTGKKNYDGIMADLAGIFGENIPKNLTVRPYFDKMFEPVLASDLILSRAGSLSISEILAAKKPSILVPYPYAAADHQRKNAREVEKTGACIYVEDNELNGESLVNIIEDILQNPDKLSILEESAKGQITSNPTFKILDLILDAAGVLENNYPESLFNLRD